MKPLAGLYNSDMTLATTKHKKLPPFSRCVSYFFWLVGWYATSWSKVHGASCETLLTLSCSFVHVYFLKSFDFIIHPCDPIDRPNPITEEPNVLTPCDVIFHSSCGLPIQPLIRRQRN